MKIKNGFVIRSVGGEHIVVPVGEMSKNFHGMINLNVTGAFLWQFFSEDHTLDEGVAAMLKNYDVEETVARRDVKNFIQTLQDNGFLA